MVWPRTRAAPVDEPVAGHDRRGDGDAPASCCSRIAAERTVLVIEHDMEFVRQIAAHGHRAAPGHGAVRGPGGAGAAATRGCSRSTSDSAAAETRWTRGGERRRRCWPSSGSTPATAARRSSGRVDLSVAAGRRWSASWAATAWARPRCSRPSWACCPPAAGRVSSTARTSRAGRPTARARAGIGYVPQGREIFPHLTVEENLRMVAARLRPRRGDARRGPGALPALAAAARPQGRRALRRQQQQLAIGRALLTAAEAADARRADRGHPALDRDRDRGGDPAHPDRAGLAVLLVEQYLDFAERLADAYVIMAKGAVVAGGPTAELRLETVRHHLAV